MSQAAEAGIANKQAALDAQQSVIDAAQATVDVDQANADLRRAGRQALRRPGRHRATAACRTPSRRPRASPRPARPSTRDTAALATALKQVDVLKAELAQAQAALARAQARAATRPS